MSPPRRLCLLARQAGVLALVLASLAARVAAQPTDAGESPASPAACAALTSDAERLACYDRFFRSAEPEAAEDASGTPGERGALLPRDARQPGRPARAGVSLLDSRWELAQDSKLGTFGFRAYQPIYLLPWFSTSTPNRAPASPAPGHSALEPEPLEDEEVKFQFSFKTKVWQGIFGKHGDLWLAYTQSSRWQLYNEELSRPFRETNYEPEALLVFATDLPVGTWRARLLGVGISHQSNGRAEPLSRSWNRVTATVGIERPGWTLSLRPWWRIAEDVADDDNPDIEDHVGRGDLLLVRHVRNHEISLLLRHSLRGGERSRGAVQLDWAFPIHGNLRAHVQLFRGYGESLIDYNHLSTQIGLGLSLIEWY
jgi:phospholipase A1/A2